MSILNSDGSGSEIFGFGFDCLSNVRVRVYSGLQFLTNFGFGFEASGLSGLTGLNFTPKSAFSDNIFDFLQRIIENICLSYVHFIEIVLL